MSGNPTMFGAMFNHIPAGVPAWPHSTSSWLCALGCVYVCDSATWPAITAPRHARLVRNDSKNDGKNLARLSVCSCDSVKSRHRLFWSLHCWFSSDDVCTGKPKRFLWCNLFLLEFQLVFEGHIPPHEGSRWTNRSVGSFTSDRNRFGDVETFLLTVVLIAVLALALRFVIELSNVWSCNVMSQDASGWAARRMRWRPRSDIEM